MNDMELDIILHDPWICADGEIIDGVGGVKLLEFFVRNASTYMSHIRKKRGKIIANKNNTKMRMSNLKKT